MRESLVEYIKMKVLRQRSCQRKPHPRVALREVILLFLEQRSCQERWNPKVPLTEMMVWSRMRLITVIRREYKNGLFN